MAAARCPTAFVTQFSKSLFPGKSTLAVRLLSFRLNFERPEKQVKGCERAEGVFKGVSGVVRAG